jgi:hypothetical protein
MKTAIQALITAQMLFSATFAFADAPAIPTLDNSSCTYPSCFAETGPVHAWVDENDHTLIMFDYYGDFAGRSEANLKMGVQINGVKIGEFQAELSQGPLALAQVHLETNMTGDLAVYYFVGIDGASGTQYDSNNGSNYHFTLQQR